MDLKAHIIEQFETVVGSHDEERIYGGPPGDPGLVGGPGSISWEVNGDLGSVAVAGMGAIIMEILHPSVMAGVYEQSSYRTQPFKRAENTMGYVLRTTFGSTDAATAVIERVRRMHERVNGTTPAGIPYRAMDPELIGWVHTAIPWAIMTAFDRYHRPLSVAEKDRYLSEQAVVGRMGGAGEIPESVADLDAYVEEMRPKLAVNHQTQAFLAFLHGEFDHDQEDLPAREQFRQRLGIHGSMSLMPRWARRLTGFDHSALAQRLYFDPVNHLTARSVRWAFGTPRCKEMALARAAAGDRAGTAAA